MKKKLLRLLLLPAILCTMLAVGTFTTAGTAHASIINTARVSCSSATDPVKIWTDYNSNTGLSDLDCFGGYGSMNVGLYQVQALYTGQYILNWTWIDCNGGTHHSAKAPHTEVTATNADGAGLFAGYYVMCKITYIQLSPPAGV